MPLTNAKLLSKELGIASSDIINWYQLQGKDIKDKYSWIEHKLAETFRRNVKFGGIEKRLKIAPILERYEFKEIDEWK